MFFIEVELMSVVALVTNPVLAVIPAANPATMFLPVVFILSLRPPPSNAVFTAVPIAVAAGFITEVIFAIPAIDVFVAVVIPASSPNQSFLNCLIISKPVLVIDPILANQSVESCVSCVLVSVLISINVWSHSSL